MTFDVEAHLNLIRLVSQHKIGNSNNELREHFDLVDQFVWLLFQLRRTFMAPPIWKSVLMLHDAVLQDVWRGLPIVSPREMITTCDTVCTVYSGRGITLSLSCITVRGAGKMETERISKAAKSLSEHVLCDWKHFSLLISTQSVSFWYNDFYTTLYFVNQRNYKTLAMQTHALTHTRYFYSLNVIISHPIVYKVGLGYLSVCAIASRSSPPSHVCICNGHPCSELCCVHCTVYNCVCDRVQQARCCFLWLLSSADTQSPSLPHSRAPCTFKHQTDRWASIMQHNPSPTLPLHPSPRHFTAWYHHF
jgi:hypothetical protein